MLNSVRLSLLLACTAVCTAPGLLPVAGFPQVSSSRFRCAMVKRDYDDDLEKWTGDKEGAEDFDDAAIAEALSKFGERWKQAKAALASALKDAGFGPHR